MLNINEEKYIAWNVENDYRIWLLGTLTRITRDLGLEDYSFKVYSEQSFAKSVELSPKVINVVLRQLTASKEYASVIQPVQITILSEQDGLEAAMIIFNKLFDEYNWKQVDEGDIRVKMQYTAPVVLNNFNIVGLGYRSVLYVSSTLYILQNVVDLEPFEENGDKHTLLIDNVEQEYIDFQFAYSMSGNTKPFPDTKFAKTIRSVQMLSVVLTVPSINSKLVEDVMKISSGAEDGNKTFVFKFKVGSLFNFDLKLISVNFVTAKNNIPSLQLGFTV